MVALLSPDRARLYARERRAYRELQAVSRILNRVATEDPGWDTLNRLFLAACATHSAAVAAITAPEPQPPASPAAPTVVGGAACLAVA